MDVVTSGHQSSSLVSLANLSFTPDDQSVGTRHSMVGDTSAAANAMPRALVTRDHELSSHTPVRGSVR